MLLHPRRQSKFEAGCIALHLAQARSNLNDLSCPGSRGQRERSCSTPSPWHTKIDEAANATPVAAHYSEFTNSTGPGVASAAAPPAGPSPPSMSSSLPRDSGENVGRSTAGEFGSSAGLAPMISSIAEGLHEELRGFLASFSSRLAAREAALAATCDRAATVGDHGLSELSKRVEDRLAAVAHQAAAEREAALDVVREGLHRLRDEVSAQHSRLESLVTGDDWGRQLREASRVFEQRSALRVEAVERHVEELRAKDAAGHRAWRDAVIHRVDAVERRLSKHFKDSNNVIDQVGKMVPDVERLQSLYDALQADRAAADTWQRRLFNCEAAMQRLGAVEAQCSVAERQSERFREETSQSLRENLHLTGNLAARVSTLESSDRSRDELWKAAEKRVLAVVEQHHKRTVSSLDILRENSQQRFTDFDTRFQQRLEHAREDLEQRVTALGSAFRRDLHSLSVDVDKLARTPPAPRGHAQAESAGMVRSRRDQPRQDVYTSPPAAAGSRFRLASTPQTTYMPRYNPPATSAPAVSSDLPVRIASASAQTHGARAEFIQERESPTPTPEGIGRRTRIANTPEAAQAPWRDTPTASFMHAAPAESSDIPLRNASAGVYTHSASAEVEKESRTAAQREASSGRSSLIGVDFNPAQMEVNASAGVHTHGASAEVAQESRTTEQREASSGRSSLIGVDFNPAQMELEASRVFSEADECANASRVSSEDYSAPGLEADRADVQHGGVSEEAEDAVDALMAQSSNAHMHRISQVEADDDTDEDVEALMAQSMRNQMPASTHSVHGTEPSKKPQAEADDAEDDVEALMAQSMRNQMPVSTHSVHGAEANDVSEQRPEVNDEATADADAGIGNSTTGHIPTTSPFDLLDAASDEEGSELREAMEAEGDADLGDDFDSEAYEGVDVEALIADTMDPQAPQGTAGFEDDRDEEDVEALMTKDMQKSQFASPSLGSQPQQAADSLRPRVGATSGTGVASMAPAAEDDDDEDVEALMAGSMKKVGSSSSPLALQGKAGMSSLSLRLGAAPAPAAGAEDDDDDDDVEALMAGSMQKAGTMQNSRPSSSPLSLQGRAGAASLRLRMGNVSSSTAAASADNFAVAGAGNAADGKEDDDDDDDDDVEALMFGSMQAGRAAPGRRAAGAKRMASSITRGPGTQASTGRDKRLNALLGLEEDDDED